MSDDKKRKKAFYKGKYGGKKGRYNNDLRPKLKGFIITCSGQDRSATVEGYRILNEYADKRYGPEVLDDNTNKSDGDDDDIEASLKEEITSIKATKDKDRRFQSVQCKPKNVIFIKAEIENPSDLALDILEDLANDQNSTGKIRHCCKLLPVADTCYAKLEQIVEASKPHLKTLFCSDASPFTYCISWKARCNNSVKRDDVYSELLKYIKEIEGEHQASYTNPDITINFDIVGNICCLGFLWNYYKYGKYNLDTVCNKSNTKEGEESADTKEAKKDGQQEDSDTKLTPITTTTTAEDNITGDHQETFETCEKTNKSEATTQCTKDLQETSVEQGKSSDNVNNKDAVNQEASIENPP